MVVSRSDKYPDPGPSADHPGRLGGFDPDEFVKASPTPDRAALVRRLDLSDPDSVFDHGHAGGVVIDAAGLVLTNYHVIDGATKIYVHLPGGTGSYADIHAADARSDLAVLKLLDPPDGLKAVTIGDARVDDVVGGKKATLGPGNLVAVLACSPAGGFEQDRPGIGLGTVTAVRRPKDVTASIFRPQEIPHRSIYRYAPILEYEAGRAAGGSGAAVLNLDGELVGLGTGAAGVVNGPDGQGYALPLDPAIRKIIATLRRGEEIGYGFLGVSLVDSQQRTGIVLGLVIPGSSAAEAGLQGGDRIVAIDGVATDTYGDLLHHIGAAQAGGKVRLTVTRVGRPFEAEVTLAKFKIDTPYIASVRPDPVFGLRVDYGSVFAQAQPRTAITPPGVVVRELVPGSPAARKFKELGDTHDWLVTRVDGTPTPDPPDFYAATKGKKAVTLTVIDPNAFNPRPRDITLP